MTVSWPSQKEEEEKINLEAAQGWEQSNNSTVLISLGILLSNLQYLMENCNWAWLDSLVTTSFATRTTLMDHPTYLSHFGKPRWHELTREACDGWILRFNFDKPTYNGFLSLPPVEGTVWCLSSCIIYHWAWWLQWRSISWHLKNSLYRAVSRNNSSYRIQSYCVIFFNTIMHLIETI